MYYSHISTKAAVLVNVAEPLQIIDNIQIPVLKRGQVLVKVLYAGLCHSQLMEIQGLRGVDKFLPHMLGHEGVGEVIDIGEGVSKVKAKDTVVLGWIKGQGLEGGSVQYKTSEGMMINAGSIAVFSEYAVLSENRLTLKPPHTPPHLASLYGCAVPTGLGMVIHNLPSDAKGTIVFLGLGGIGLSALLSIKLYDFSRVIVIDVNEEKLALAKELGATHTINAILADSVGEVMQLTEGVGVDYSFESAGRADTIEQAFAMVRKNGGKCIFASHPAAGDKIQLDPFDLICGKKIEGTWGGNCTPDSDIAKFDQYYQQGLLPLESLLSKQYELENINQAIDDLKNKKIVRASIAFDKV